MSKAKLKREFAKKHFLVLGDELQPQVGCGQRYVEEKNLGSTQVLHGQVFLLNNKMVNLKVDGEICLFVKESFFTKVMKLEVVFKLNSRRLK